MDVTHCSVAELAAKLQNKEISAVEVAQQYLDRIEAHKDLNAFLDVRPEETLRQAEAADARIAKGEAGPLTGVPIAHKDIFVTQEWNSTAASRMLEGYRSPFDATVVSKLKSEGMVCLNINQVPSARSVPVPAVSSACPGIFCAYRRAM